MSPLTMLHLFIWVLWIDIIMVIVGGPLILFLLWKTRKNEKAE